MPLEKDSVIECEIESLAYGGRGVARVDGMAVFVAGGLPGDTVSARIVKAKKRFAEAVTESVVKPSEHRVDAVCPHFGTCGGCSIQDLDYPEQLAQKAAQVESALSRIGGVDSLVMDDPIASPAIWRYRNKMEFSFEQEGATLHLGLRGRPEAGAKIGPVIDIEECHLCAMRDLEIMKTVREYCRESKVVAYHPQTDTGFWRHLVIRHTSIGQVQVHVITTADERKYNLPEALGEIIVDRFPEVVSYVHSTRVKRSTLAFGQKMIYRLGHKFVEEHLPKGEDGGTSYHLSPNTFFQTNTGGAVELFGTIAEYSEFKSSDTLLDLYCGAGAIGLYFADEVANVIGYELSDEAISKAWASAKLNEYYNCQFFALSLDLGIEGVNKLPTPDVVVVDPPRSGMQEKTAESLLRLAPKKIIAVSCDPSTLARDVKRLSSKYELKRARAVDMFPHTHHIETVALLVRK